MNENKFSYLIDGHNLIPKIAGLSLKTIDDEEQLIELLQIFSRVNRKPVEVFFDNAPAGRSGIRQRGVVRVNYVRQGTLADDAIIARLRSLGKAGKNLTVVSSDRRVQIEARSLQAKVISSEEFANLLDSARMDAIGQDEGDETSMNDKEIREWLDLFSRKPGNSGK